ncbi:MULTISPECIES: nuclear transport factor 2 family protein [Streptomyces]|uniref:nuclear transport factor 2 family protein n=1 Tax=Streptomyces TaxID=1883 RepID=UPI00099F31D2|nr:MULTISPECIES: nuclear transport factor 2 family protein [Streptomyces]
MSKHKAIVERYRDGVLSGDPEQVLSLVTDDVVWESLGQVRVQGKDALRGVVQNKDGVAAQGVVQRPEITVDRLIEEGDTVVATGRAALPLPGGAKAEFLFCDVFTFVGDAISHLESYKVSLTPPPQAPQG